MHHFRYVLPYIRKHRLRIIQGWARHTRRHCMLGDAAIHPESRDHGSSTVTVIWANISALVVILCSPPGPVALRVSARTPSIEYPLHRIRSAERRFSPSPGLDQRFYQEMHTGDLMARLDERSKTNAPKSWAWE